MRRSEGHLSADIGRQSRSTFRVEYLTKTEERISDAREIERHSGIRFVDKWCYFDYHKARAGLVGCIVRLPFIRRRIFPRIARLRFNGPNAESD
jgi:hypothetical protein